jgi:hypothetical protein
MANPLLDQGVLNRIRASVVFPSNPQLSIISSNLAREGIRLALEGNATDYFGTMTGAVPSPAPYQLCTLTLNMLKSQPLSNVYKAQFELNTQIGPATVRPDATTLGLYQLNQMVLETIREMTYAGEDPVYSVTCRGYYLVNSYLFNT